MFANMEDLSGKKFGKLLALWCAGRAKCRKIVWSCQCECGTVTTVFAGDLKSGKTKSCNCIQKEWVMKNVVTHGKSGGPEYRSYAAAKNRCNNPNARCWESYGGRGIRFKFDSFEEFLDHVGHRPSLEYSLDRINNDGHYEKGNVRWATIKEQNHNQRRYYALAENEKLRERITELEWHGATYADFAIQGHNHV